MPPVARPYAATASAMISGAVASSHSPARSRPPPLRKVPAATARTRPGQSSATTPHPTAGPNWVSWTTSAGIGVPGWTAPSAPAATNATPRNTPAIAPTRPRGPTARTAAPPPCGATATAPSVLLMPISRPPSTSRTPASSTSAIDDAVRRGHGHCTWLPNGGVPRYTPPAAPEPGAVPEDGPDARRVPRGCRGGCGRVRPPAGSRLAGQQQAPAGRGDARRVHRRRRPVRGAASLRRGPVGPRRRLHFCGR